MNRYIKLIVILIVILGMTGCAEDDYETYKQYLGSSGITCSYKPDDSNKAFGDINEIKFKALTDKITVSYTYNSNDYTFNYIIFKFNNNGKVTGISTNNNHVFGSYDINYKNFNYENYLKEYQSTNSCPSNIYIDNYKSNNGIFYGNIYETTYNTNYISFKLKSSSGNDSNKGINKDTLKNSNKCTYNTDNCKKYERKTYLDGNITLELGTLNTTINGKDIVDKYFCIIGKSNSGCQMAHGNTSVDSANNSVGQYKYVIRASDWNLLFLSDTSFVDDDSLVIDEKSITGDYVVNITVKGSKTLDQYKDVSSVEDVTKDLVENDVSVPIPYIPTINDLDCESLLGDPTLEKTPAWYLTKAFEVVRYVAIGLVLVFTIMDFVGAVTSGDDDSLKKATSKLITRLILCVIIFLLPMLIKFILKYLNNRAIDLCINA